MGIILEKRGLCPSISRFHCPGARIRTQLLSFFHKQANLVELAFLAIHMTYALRLGPILEERVGEIVKRV